MAAPVRAQEVAAPFPKSPEGIILKPVPAADAASLFFPQEQVDALRQAVELYNQNLLQRHNRPAQIAQPQQPKKQQPDDYLTALTKNKPGQKGKTPPAPPPVVKELFDYPQFYMEFLMYHSASSWMVLVNGQKYASDMPADPAAELRVVTVQPERVVFEWKPKNMDRIRESWDGEASYNVSVDYPASKVTFALRLNQTFSSYLMQVVEGKVTPVRSAEPLPVNPNSGAAALQMDMFPPEPAEAQEPVQANGKAKPSKAIKLDGAAGGAKKEGQEGLGGLLSNYKDINE